MGVPQITIDDLAIGFRGPRLLDGVSCKIEAGERIGLLGRNGSGKTTLMRILCGHVEPDAGRVSLAAHVKLALLPQDVPTHIQQLVGPFIIDGYPVTEGIEQEEHDWQWRAEHAMEQIASRMGLDPKADFASLSSGMKRRVLLAQALVGDPDVLLLDEPTNHLDIQAIEWLEDFLNRWRGTLMFVTHDRAFLRRLATRIIEIDRGRLFDWSCNYDTFLKRKEAALAAEAQQAALFDRKLAEEEVWIRQGIKARRTRNEGRVRTLQRMRVERHERRERSGTSRLQIQEAQRSGNLIADLRDVSFSYDAEPIIQRLSTTVMRGDKVGMIGPNGSGKTTLLKLILGQLEPQQGTVRLGTNLAVAYFDQLRGQLDEEKTVQENVGDGYETIRVGDKPKHILGYLQDFLFTPSRARTLVRFLSGGERNRILLAKLFAKPANVIVLDEPTNDLDAETLELLEERLMEFKGTVLVVSHDREFLNNVVTSTLAFEAGQVREYVGGYDDWLRQSKSSDDAQATVNTATDNRAGRAEASKRRSTDASKPRKLKYKEQQELERLPVLIEQLEAEISQLHEKMADPIFYKQSGDTIADTQKELSQAEAQLAEAYDRWEYLENLEGG